MNVVVISHAAVTLAMTALMIYVQVELYPGFRDVPATTFETFAADHATSMVRRLALIAPAEIILAAAIFLRPADGLNRSALFVAGLLLAIGWVATAAWFAPLHGRLQQGRDGELIEQLITTNWLRTVLWIARSGFAIWFVVAVLRR